MDYPQQHPDQNVRDALVRLADALCSWERSTSRSSILIFREQDGFCIRMLDGKPVGTLGDLTDEQMLEAFRLQTES